jgi:trehalose/maltose hydrolase-like predicted phosphorylase
MENRFSYANDTWKVVYDKFVPAKEKRRESLCTLGNGYFGTRGAAPEAKASKVHYPGTYIAGVYNTLGTQIAGKTIYNEDLVNCPNWLHLTFRIGGDEWVSLQNCKVLSYYQELNMRNGVLSRNLRLRDRKGRVSSIKSQRIVHMNDPHRAAISYTVTPENYSGWIVIKSALDGSVENAGVPRYRDLNSEHLRAKARGPFSKNGIFLSVKTSQSNVEICQASRVYITSRKKMVKHDRELLTEEKKMIFQEFRVFAQKRQPYRIEKIMAVYTSRDAGISSPLTAAIESVKRSPLFAHLLWSHGKAWERLWSKYDIKIKGDDFSQKALRLHIFHLLQSASIHNKNIDAGLPARGLHGEAYRGHIFWDNIFATHLYDLHDPEIGKSLLLYRFRRLPKARKYARQYGYRGAMFPWQSASTGDETTQEIHLNPKSGKWNEDHSRVQRHISFAVAYDVWQHWNRTADIDFMVDYGAEMLLSIARFGSSLSKYDPKDSRYHTEGLMGPDEFHEMYAGSKKSGVKDNAYTNLMIAWTLARSLEILRVLPEYHRKRILNKLEISQRELSKWDDIIRNMNIIIDENGIISQFDGYFDLKELNWLVYKIKYRSIKRLDRILNAEGLSPDEYKVSKQADAIMIFYLLTLPEVKELFRKMGHEFRDGMLRKNYNYYLRRTSHGSTLSKVVHCYISNLLGRTQEARAWYKSVLMSDLYDTQGGTTPEGIHAGVMGGSVDIAIRGFAGVNMADNVVKINPRLPKDWKSIKFRLFYRGRWISFSVTHKQVTLFIRGKEKMSLKPLPVDIRGRVYHLSPNKRYRLPLA